MLKTGFGRRTVFMVTLIAAPVSNTAWHSPRESALEAAGLQKQLTPASNPQRVNEALSPADLAKLKARSNCNDEDSLKRLGHFGCPLDEEFVVALGLGKRGERVPAKHLYAKSSQGTHFISFVGGQDDIVLVYQLADADHLYLTDSTQRLRRAVIQTDQRDQVIPVEQAAEAYGQELRVWAAIASTLNKAPGIDADR